MRKIILVMILLCAHTFAYAQGTQRIPQFNNSKVRVWRTIIYPSIAQQLKMHHHTRDRVLVALTNGKIKIANDKGEQQLIELTKNQAYFLPKDKAQEEHTDENIGTKPIEVLVIELL